MKNRKLSTLLVFIIMLFSFACAEKKADSVSGATPHSKKENKEEKKKEETANEEYKFIAGSYNIHVCKGIDKKLSIERIAGVITSAGADVIGLQEIDKNVKRTNNVDQLAKLKEITKMDGVFGKSINFQGGEFGIGILTKGKILETKHELYPIGKEEERRSFIAAKIELPNKAIIWAVNTHLSLVAEDRKVQARTIVSFIRDKKEPVIFVGDFNEETGKGDGIFDILSNSFEDTWLIAKKKEGGEKGFSFSSEKPDRRIDYIMLDKNHKWKADRFFIKRTIASDHLPIFAELTLIK